MGVQAGMKHNIGVTVKQVEAWLRKSQAGEELRAAKGLYLRRSERGAFWTFRARSPATARQIRINLWADDPEGEKSYPTATLAEALARAAKLRELIGAGIDPLLQVQQQRAAALERQQAAEEAARLAALERERRLTVRQLFERWASIELTPRLGADKKRRLGRKDNGAYVRQQFERRLFPKWGDVPAADVTKADWLSVLDQALSENKARTSNVLLADIKQMLNFAQARDLIAHNPLASVKKRNVGGADTARERTLSEDEIGELAAALLEAGLGVRSECAVWLALATGVRIGELTGAVWAESLPSNALAAKARLAEMTAVCTAQETKLGVVNRAARTWHLPTTKNGRPHTIHLSDFALAQLDRLHAVRELLPEPEDGEQPGQTRYSPWVFPGRKAHLPLNVKTIGKQLADRQKAKGQRLSHRTQATTALELSGGKWTAHDLRRTAASMMARLGFSSDVANECLNHITADRMTRIYIRDRRVEDQHRAFDALGRRLAHLYLAEGSAGAGGEVIPLRAA